MIEKAQLRFRPEPGRTLGAAVAALANDRPTVELLGEEWLILAETVVVEPGRTGWAWCEIVRQIP